MRRVRLGRRFGVLEQRYRLDAGHYTSGDHQGEYVHADQENTANAEQHQKNAWHRILRIIVKLHFDQIHLIGRARKL